MSEKGPKYKPDGELGISKAWEDQVPDILDGSAEDYLNSTAVVEQIDDGIEAITREQREAREKLRDAEAIDRLSKSLSDNANIQETDMVTNSAIDGVDKIRPKNKKFEKKNHLNRLLDWAESRLRKLLGVE